MAGRAPTWMIVFRNPVKRLRLVNRKKRLSEHGLQSERVLWPGKGPGVFEQEVAALERALGLTTIEKALAWAQTHSMWPDQFGLSCCTIEMAAVVSPRYDIARFGMEYFRPTPRQADLLIVPGRLSHKMAAPLRQIYDQMLEPKWVIAMGACASSGRHVQQLRRPPGSRQDRPGRRLRARLPPAPEALIEGILRLHEKIRAGIPPAYEMRGVARAHLENLLAAVSKAPTSVENKVRPERRGILGGEDRACRGPSM